MARNIDRDVGVGETGGRVDNGAVGDSESEARLDDQLLFRIRINVLDIEENFSVIVEFRVAVRNFLSFSIDL